MSSEFKVTWYLGICWHVSTHHKYFSATNSPRLLPIASQHYTLPKSLLFSAPWGFTFWSWQPNSLTFFCGAILSAMNCAIIYSLQITPPPPSTPLFIWHLFSWLATFSRIGLFIWSFDIYKYNPCLIITELLQLAGFGIALLNDPLKTRTDGCLLKHPFI